jgi:hypothetical protein
VPFASFDVTHQGVAFDPSTNILFLSPTQESDVTAVYDFTTFSISNGNASAAHALIKGLGEAGYLDEGPGGFVALNCMTHQAAVADKGGQNVKLVQLPQYPITGPPDNNGQPYTDTVEDANSAYTLGDTLIIKSPCGHQLYLEDAPNLTAVDPAQNVFFAIANTCGQNLISCATQYVLRLDLNNPGSGGCPANSFQLDGDTGNPCLITWSPAQTVTLLPGTNDCPAH